MEKEKKNFLKKKKKNKAKTNIYSAMIKNYCGLPSNMPNKVFDKLFGNTKEKLNRQNQRL